MTTSIPFPYAPHRKFSHTFLKEVRVKLSYRNGNWNEDIEKIIDAIKHIFELSDIHPQNKGENFNAISLNSKNDALTVNFTPYETSLIIGHEGYDDFNASALPIVKKMLDVMKLGANITQYESISIRKIDMWILECKENPDIFKAADFLFAHQYLPIQRIDNEQALNGGSKEWKWQKGNEGYLHVSNSAWIADQGYIKATMSTKAWANQLKADTVPERLLGLNQWLFDAFIAIISPNVLSLMEDSDD